MFGKRTARRIKYNVRQSLFRVLGMQSMLDEQEIRCLEDIMGFRGQWDELRRFQVALVQNHGLERHHSFLEIGCGPLTAGIPIIEYLNVGKYCGMDIREVAASEAYRQISKSGLSVKNPRILVTDNFGANDIESCTFDYIMAFSVLAHLDNDMLAECITEMSRRMHEHSVFIANVNTDMPSSRWLEFPFVKRELSAYEAAGQRAGLQMDILGQLKDLDFRLTENVERFHYVITYQKSR